MVVLDTNIIIDHLRRLTAQSVLTRLLVNHTRDQLKVSIISIQELYAGNSTKDPQREERMLNMVTQFEILPYDFKVARLAGQIIRESTHHPDLADTAIAATAIANGAKLLTLNPKHFRGIPKLVLYQR